MRATARRLIFPTGSVCAEPTWIALLLFVAACSAGKSTRGPAHAQTAPAGTHAQPAGPDATPSAGARAAAERGAEAESGRDAPPKRAQDYSHHDVLALLRASDAVLPPPLPVHPVRAVYNREAIVPPMCYTRTEGTHNPCYVCHQDARKGRPNQMDDGDLQRGYSFSELGQTNHWQNLFVDRSERIAAISDADIQRWVEQDNYSELPSRLRAAGFKGYIPDLAHLERAGAAFDAQGFAKDGSHWVAFKYMPMPSTFWPTNGAVDDVMIRLPAAYRTTRDGKYERAVYRANLALVEANIKGLSEISVDPIDERTVGVDLDADGELGSARRIVRMDHYVGAAEPKLKLPFLYPQDTEFLHSVRYLGVGTQGEIVAPPRMKELRYMRKRWTTTEPQLFEAYENEKTAKMVGDLPGYVYRGEHGLDNEMGWVVFGFIEGKDGRLRAGTYEETLFCMGCHTSLGSTVDSTFSLARKVDGARGWGYMDLRGMPDVPSVGEREGSIATYLERVGGGGEFRQNPEMEARWFRDGELLRDKVRAAKDAYELVAPSKERALALNKAYRLIVEEQSFIFGRDATVTPAVNVYEQVDAETAPTLPSERTYAWDLRLDWSRAP